jgi:hypothetical protein
MKTANANLTVSTRKSGREMTQKCNSNGARLPKKSEQNSQILEGRKGIRSKDSEIDPIPLEPSPGD